MSADLGAHCPECGDSLASLSQGIIIYLAPIPWGYLWQRPQQLTSRLAGVIQVFYVQPEGLRNLSMRDLGRGPRRLSLHFHRAPEQPPPAGLQVLAPPLLPFAGSALVDRLNSTLTASTVSRALRHRSPPPAFTILWCTRPAPLAQRLASRGPHTLLVYEIMDAIPPTHPMADRLAEVERALIRHADLVVCTSEPLMEHARRLNAQPHLIPNGVDPRHFQDEAPKRGRDTAPLASLGGPIVGFYGTIGEWIDFDLLGDLAERLPTAQFVMIGPVEVPRALLPQRRNLHWIGPRNYRDLPAYLSSFTVCLLPLRVDEFTRAINPVKLFEYFATGKPVVSTGLPEVSAFGELVYVGKGPDGVAAVLEAALAEQDRLDLIRRRQAVAEANTWDQRVAGILHLLHTLPPRPA